jgi:16S rRNA (adenine1518-N6/adenine1519-N6)-dimethyltransferase
MNINAKKSLGQNFLKSKLALNKMVEAGEINNNDLVLEVGPGKGVLTEKLLEKAKKVIAVEKDDRLIPFLQERFATEIKNDKFEIIHGDILDFEGGERGYKIIANIPYYITGQFLRKFLETDNQPERIIVMVQKEIADRIVAREGKENLLSLSVKAYGIPKKIMKVDKENFSPAPKVDSAILAITNISKRFFTENSITEEKFFEVLHAGFAHKRKVLSSNLKGLIFPEKISTLPKNIRAEDLKLQDWASLLK